MSEEIKKTEKTEQTDLSEQELDNVAGGKDYYESRSNTAETLRPRPVVITPVAPNKGGPPSRS